uniref:Photosystem I reaction center subunit IV n=1 Tax=Dictyopteris divaricata TaxID=156996 RepID=A0A2I4Q2J2_9PHAE|nr:photosystem I reaction center subunit IV [Dictyopteris divaricata]YP_010205360.1 photosystem I reaction center subunit IV [Grateloupia livida]AQZ25071.1 photosystem I reaction center subunit IV [Dictyopteris divaricata]UAV85929.1 photosystem I reaction center subunit IV [Grateloupia livida]
MVSKGDNVRILRKESYWFNELGKIIVVEQKASTYPILVRFTKVNYSGNNTANFKVEELLTEE